MAALASAAGCSSGGGGGGGGGSGNVDCNAACVEITGVGCSKEQTQTACVSECQAYANQCPAEMASYAACIADQATFQCDPDGEADILGCEPQVVVASPCITCVRVATDNPCEDCVKTKCCNEAKTFAGTADAPAFSRCVDACATQACIDGCTAQYPSLKTPFETLIGCATTTCYPVCSNEGP